MINLNPEIIKELREYLLSHESDIAQRMNDFGELESVFVGFLGWMPDGDAEYRTEYLQ